MTIPLISCVIVPATISDANLISCSVAEPASGETAWVSDATYAIGDVVQRSTTHKRYKRLTAGSGTTPPESDTTNWLDIGYDNRWSQFDRKIGSQTTGTGSITTVIAAGSVEGVALLELQGRTATVEMTETAGGSGVYSRTIDLDNTAVTDVYDWMFGEFVQKRAVVLTDLPGQFPSGHLRVTISGTGAVALGVLAAGRVHKIGSAQYSAGAGIINWGKVNDDGFGNREWVSGEWANRVKLPLLMNRSDFSRVHRTLAGLRSTPCIYIGSDLGSLDPLICYGVYRDFYITVDNYPLCSTDLEIDGLNNY